MIPVRGVFLLVFACIFVVQLSTVKSEGLLSGVLTTLCGDSGGSQPAPTPPCEKQATSPIPEESETEEEEEESSSESLPCEEESSESSVCSSESSVEDCSSISEPDSCEDEIMPFNYCNGRYYYRRTLTCFEINATCIETGEVLAHKLTLAAPQTVENLPLKEQIISSEWLIPNDEILDREVKMAVVQSLFS